jgi:hypothetical protein
MTERIDHAGEAVKSGGRAQEFFWQDCSIAEQITFNLLDAQSHATLALAAETAGLKEQARIANLIALSDMRARSLAEASDPWVTSWDAMFQAVPNPAIPGEVKWVLRPDIAAALGLDQS